MIATASDIRYHNEETHSKQKPYTSREPFYHNFSPVLILPHHFIRWHLTERIVRNFYKTRARVPYKSPSPSRVRWPIINVLRSLHNQLCQMAIIRAKISVLLEAMILSMHRISMPMLDQVAKSQSRHLIRVWEFGPFEYRAWVEKILVAFLVGALQLRTLDEILQFLK